MGDTGSLGLGGALAALAILSRTELLLVLIGGLFLIVTGSVILQTRLLQAHASGDTAGQAHLPDESAAPSLRAQGLGRDHGRRAVLAHRRLFVAAGVGLFYLEWISR